MSKLHHNIKNGWLFLWLAYVAASYLIPWWSRIYFLWDDVEFLMRLRQPNLQEFFLPHQYQFHPIFNLAYWLEIQVFGVNPSAFFLIAVLNHIINISLVYKIISRLTTSIPLSLAAAILVSFNKSYYTVIFWPSIFSNQLLTTFLLLAVIIFLKLENASSKTRLVAFAILLLLASFSQGFGIGAGFVFGIITLIFWRNRKNAKQVAIWGSLTGIISIVAMLPFSIPEVGQNQIFSLSFRRISNLIYFTAVGPSQAVVSRFFLPGFVPNIHSPLNIAVMITLPAVVLIFLATVIIKNRKNKPRLAPLFLFSTYTVIPYFIASLARSGPGALGGLAERYVYPPFFFFILALVYALHLASRQRKFPYLLTKAILPATVIILSIGQQIVMHLEVSHLFLP